MELRHLRYFVAVAEELNFTRAAQRLHTAQPSLSQQIRQLEDEVGVRLLERTKRSVQLTAAGRVMLREARDLLSRVEYAIHIAAKAAIGQAGEIAVGTFPGADVRILPRLRPLMVKRLPDVRLVAHSRYVVDPIGGLRSGMLDVAFLRPPCEEPDLVSEVVLTEKIVVVLPAHHRMARAPRVDVRRLDLPCIAMSQTAARGLHDAVTEFYRQAQVTVQAAARADNALGHLNMVAAGLGFALLPEYVAAMLPEGVAIRPLDWKPVPTVATIMVYRRRDTPPIIRPFREIVRECFPRED